MRFFLLEPQTYIFLTSTRLKMHHHIHFDQFCPMLCKWAVKLDEIIGYGYHGRRANVDHVWKFKRGFCQRGHNYSCLLESVCNEFLLDLSKRCKRKNTWVGKESASLSCACVHACVNSSRRDGLFSIGNSMICSDIWHKYHEWYFEIVIRNFPSH